MSKIVDAELDSKFIYTYFHIQMKAQISIDLPSKDVIKNYMLSECSPFLVDMIDGNDCLEYWIASYCRLSN